MKKISVAITFLAIGLTSFSAYAVRNDWDFADRQAQHETERKLDLANRLEKDFAKRIENFEAAVKVMSSEVVRYKDLQSAHARFAEIAGSYDDLFHFTDRAEKLVPKWSKAQKDIVELDQKFSNARLVIDPIPTR